MNITGGNPFVYSMGNFFFPREGERGKSWDYGYCSELEITEAGVSLSVHPYRFGSQELTLLQGGEAREGFLRYLACLSEPIADAGGYSRTLTAGAWPAMLMPM